MMKAKKTILTLFVLIISCTVLFAASSKDLFQEFSDNISSGDLSAAKETYSDLQDKIKSEASSAEKQMEKAYSKGNMELYLEARNEYRDLSGCMITKEQSDALLSMIVEEDAENAGKDAEWLYSISPYYRPTLSLDYSASGDNYSYSYSSSITVKPNSDVTLPDQEALGANSNRLGNLAGWGVTKDSVTYLPGETIKMPLTDQTLYAIWENSVTFKDEKTGIDEKNADVAEGDEIAVPSVSAADDGSVFAGWIDNTSGEYIAPDETVYTVRGSGANFVALYSNLEIKDLKTIPYSTLPENTQVTLTFYVENTGNEDMKNLEVNISSDDEDLSILTDTLYFRRLPAGGSGYVSTKVVYTGSESSRSIPLNISVSDSDGNTWSQAFTVTSK